MPRLFPGGTAPSMRAPPPLPSGLRRKPFLAEGTMLKKIECFIQPGTLDALRDEMLAFGVDGMSVLDVRGFGRERGFDEKEGARGEPVRFLPKLKVEIVIEEEMVDGAIRRIQSLARAGTVGEGKVFVVPVEDALRLSTGEKGRNALG